MFSHPKVPEVGGRVCRNFLVFSQIAPSSPDDELLPAVLRVDVNGCSDPPCKKNKIKQKIKNPASVEQSHSLRHIFLLFVSFRFLCSLSEFPDMLLLGLFLL